MNYEENDEEFVIDNISLICILVIEYFRKCQKINLDVIKCQICILNWYCNFQGVNDSLTLGIRNFADGRQR